jgi:hypothetical protein
MNYFRIILLLTITVIVVGEPEVEVPSNENSAFARAYVISLINFYPFYITFSNDYSSESPVKRNQTSKYINLCSFTQI